MLLSQVLAGKYPTRCYLNAFICISFQSNIADTEHFMASIHLKICLRVSSCDFQNKIKKEACNCLSSRDDDGLETFHKSFASTEYYVT